MRIRSCGSIELRKGGRGVEIDPRPLLLDSREPRSRQCTPATPRQSWPVNSRELHSLRDGPLRNNFWDVGYGDHWPGLWASSMRPFLLSSLAAHDVFAGWSISDGTFLTGDSGASQTTNQSPVDPGADLPDEHALVVLTGELDMASAPQLSARLAELAEEKVKHVVIDLSGLGFIDSSGLSLLLSEHKRVDALGGELIILSPGRQARRVFELTGLDLVFNIRPTSTPVPDPQSCHTCDLGIEMRYSVSDPEPKGHWSHLNDAEGIAADLDDVALR
jgi:anti-anti-sigma factor